jgi:hypothetical protein
MGRDCVIVLIHCPGGASKIVASEIIIRHAAPAATAPAIRRRSGSSFFAEAAQPVRLCRIAPDMLGIWAIGWGGD